MKYGAIVRAMDYLSRAGLPDEARAVRYIQYALFDSLALLTEALPEIADASLAIRVEVYLVNQGWPVPRPGALTWDEYNR